MNPNQYYGSPANFMPNAATYYQPPIMSPRAAEPHLPPPIQVQQFNPPVITQPNLIPQYNPPQYQSVNYSVNPNVQSSPIYQPVQENSTPNTANVVQSPRVQHFQCGQTGQMPYYPNQNITAQTCDKYSNPNQYMNGPQPLQNVYSIPTNDARNLYPPQVDPQQFSYSTNPNTSNMPITHMGDSSAITIREPPQCKGPTQAEVPKYKPTNVIGEYKCSDFPNLYTGPFRYSGSPVQRKPFTLKHDHARHAFQTNPDRRTHIGLARHAKRWELRGGKYYGCFTSRTNGLQDVCPKAKCKLCPIDKKR